MKVIRGLVATGVAFVCCLAGCSAVDDEPATTQSQSELLQAAPADAVPCPADYDGDGFTDYAVKGSNGIWYIDVAACSVPGAAETDCTGSVDDDGDDVVNDGCPAVGAAETSCNDFLDNDADGYVDDGCPAKTAATGAPEPNALCNNYRDDDGDGVADDGCTVDPQCLGNNGYGGRWDFAYPGYGGSTAKPVPADYGSIAGPADGRVDLAIRDTSSGMWAIDYADNGFGTWDWIGYGYGYEAASVALAADFDGDRRADLSVWGTDGGATNGHWHIDYSSDGFGYWDRPCTGCPCTAVPGDVPLVGYGLIGDTPAVGDFDGDGCADLSIKTSDGDPPAGRWFFDLATSGFGYWEAPCPGCAVPLTGYGNASFTPIIANYDPQIDGKADLGVKDPNGYWWIDYASDRFGVFNFRQYYGGSNYTGFAGNFDTSLNPAVPRQLDLGLHSNTTGYWYLDLYSASGYAGSGDTIPGTGTWYVYNPGRVLVDTTKPSIQSVTLTKPFGNPWPDTPENGNFRGINVSASSLKIGVRYTATVTVKPGTPGPTCTDNVNDPYDGCPVGMGCYSDPPGGAGVCEYRGGVTTNPDLRVPGHLNVIPKNGNGITPQLLHATLPNGNTGSMSYIRRFSFTCTQWGEYPLGFRFDDHEHQRWNPDYGMKVACTSDYPGLYGTVTVKTIGTRETRCDNVDDDGDGLKDDGCAISGASIAVDGVTVATSNYAGLWNASSFTGGPHTISVTKAGYSETRAVNVTIPPWPVGSVGVEIDTPLEEDFTAALGTSNTYTTFIDYSRGRTIMHTVAIAADQLPIKMNRVPSEPQPGGYCTTNNVAPDQYMTLKALAAQLNTPVLINGLWINGSTDCHTTDDYFDGYFYSHDQSWTSLAQHPLPEFFAAAWCSGTRTLDANNNVVCNGTIEAPNRLPMFGINGTGTSQRASVIMTDRDFTALTNGWTQIPVSGSIIYDVQTPFNVSDYSYAAQQPPLVLDSGQVVARGLVNTSGIPWDDVFARTVVGVNSTGTRVWFVIADGEGIDGGGGATANQMGEFLRTLGASSAINFDSGESAELVLKGAAGWRRINVLTSENAAADTAGCSPACGDYSPSGRVGAYISAGP